MNAPAGVVLWKVDSKTKSSRRGLVGECSWDPNLQRREGCRVGEREKLGSEAVTAKPLPGPQAALQAMAPQSG